MRKWLRAIGTTTAQVTKEPAHHADAESAAFARAYVALVEAAHAAGVDLDAAVERELEARGITHAALEAEAVRQGE